MPFRTGPPTASISEKEGTMKTAFERFLEEIQPDPAAREAARQMIGKSLLVRFGGIAGIEKRLVALDVVVGDAGLFEPELSE